MGLSRWGRRTERALDKPAPPNPKSLSVGEQISKLAADYEAEATTEAITEGSIVPSLSRTATTSTAVVMKDFARAINSAALSFEQSAKRIQAASQMAKVDPEEERAAIESIKRSIAGRDSSPSPGSQSPG